MLLVDTPPTAVDDTRTLKEDRPATGLGVRVNDLNADGGPFEVISVTDPDHGTVTQDARTRVFYEPDPDYCNQPPGTTPDTFTYTLVGGSTATVTVNVQCVDDPPTAVDDTRTLDEDSPPRALGVRGNDLNADGGPFRIVSATDPAHGTVTRAGPGGRISYEPDPDYCNKPPGTTPDTFTYTLSRGSTATVTVHVNCVDDGAVAGDDTKTVTEDDPATTIDVLANDNDADGGPGPSITGTTDPTNGTVVITNGGADLTYEPDGDYCNGGSPTDDFDYTLTPGGDTGTVAVTVTCVNDAPALTQPDGALTYTEDTPTENHADAIAPNLTAQDPDTNISSATVEISGNYQNGQDVLSFTDTAQITGNFSAASGELTLTGSTTPANYQAALRDVKYSNTSDTPNTSTRTVSFQADDGQPLNHASNTVTRDISVVATNDNPVADDEAFNGANSAVGNTPLAVGTTQAQPTKTITGDVLTGDTDVDGPGGLTAGPTGVKAITTQDGGKVTMESDGNFTFFPATSTSCGDANDQFNYTVSDQNPGTPGTDTGTVSIAITDCVWYVDNSLGSNGDGSGDSPFNSLLGVNGAAGLGDSDGPGHRIFILNAGSYTGGMPMEANQSLSSRRHGLTIGADTIVTASGASNPTITSSSGNALTLANSNTIQGIDLGNGANTSLGGSFFSGTATMNTVTSGAISNTVSKAVDISNGTVDMAFTSVSSTNSGTDGIRLDNVAGTFNASSGSIQNAADQDVDISGNNSGDSVDFTYGGTIADSTGTAVNVSNQSGGTKDFNGTIGTSGSPAGAISLASNTGTTIRFDGGTILSTGGINAFSATGGGTVVVTDPNAVGTAPDNTLATTTGTALNVAGTTIGAADLNFKSISANDAVNGIVLNATGSSGGLTVTGDSSGLCGGQVTNNPVGTPATVTAPNPADCTGGTIQATTGTAVSLTNTDQVSLTRMRILNSAADGVTVNDINGFALNNSLITDSSGVAQDRGIEMGDFSTGTPVNGAITISDSTIGPTPHDNFGVGIGSGTSTWDISDTVFTDSQLNSGFNFEIRNATVSNFLMNNVVASSQFADGMQMQPASGVAATMPSATIQNSTFSGNNIGMDLNHDGTGSVNYKVLSNTFLNQVANSINFFSSAVQAPATGGTLNGTFTGNRIGDASIFNSGGGIGIRININGGVDANVLVNSNTIRQIPNGRGIEIVSRNGTGGLDATVTNNFVNTDFVPTVANGGFSLANIFLQANAVTVPNTLRADIRGNTVPATPPTGELIGFQLAYLESNGATGQLVDNAPASADASAELTSQNTGSAGANAGVSLIAGPINTPPP